MSPTYIPTLSKQLHSDYFYFHFSVNYEQDFMYGHNLYISLCDKWRLPLILVRVSKSLPLRESDAKIWACFVHNKTNEELVETIAVALAENAPIEDRKALRSMVHAALLPEHCPFPVSRAHITATPLTVSGCSTPTVYTSRRNSHTGIVSPRAICSLSSSESHPAVPGNNTTTMQGNNNIAARKEGCGTTMQIKECSSITNKPRCRPSVHPLSNLWPLHLPSPRKVTPIVVATDIVEQEDSELALARTFGTVGNTKESRLAQLDCSHIKTERCLRRRTWMDRLGLPVWVSDLWQRRGSEKVTPTSSTIW